MGTMTYHEALTLALYEEMRRDERVFVIGEGVGLNDGAYEMTERLLSEFDARRVVHLPTAESGFTGVGIGAAMVGLRPVVEMSTFNFALLALDQIVNTAANLCYVSGRPIGRPSSSRALVSPGGAPRSPLSSPNRPSTTSTRRSGASRAPTRRRPTRRTSSA